MEIHEVSQMLRRVFDLETGELAGEVEIDEVSGLTRFISGSEDLRACVKSSLWRGPIAQRSSIERINGEVACCSYDSTVTPSCHSYRFALKFQYECCGARLELLDGDFEGERPLGPMPPPEYGFEFPEEAWFQRWKPGWHPDENKRRF